jgi:hypothetical protein
MLTIGLLIVYPSNQGLKLDFSKFVKLKIKLLIVYPSNQGLKLGDIAEVVPEAALLIVYPSNQGLKPDKILWLKICHLSFNCLSIKPRIETRYYLPIFLYSSSFNCLSIKPRIETFET